MLLFSFVLEGMVLYFTLRCNTDTPSLQSRLRCTKCSYDKSVGTEQNYEVSVIYKKGVTLG